MKKRVSLLLCVLLALAACGITPATQGTDPAPSAPYPEDAGVAEERPEAPEEDSPPFLSVSLLYNGREIVFTSADDMERLANVLIDQRQLEDTESLATPDDAVTAVFQDGPGSNFKLVLYPAYVEKLREEVLVIQGELFAFYTDIANYEIIEALLS